MDFRLLSAVAFPLLMIIGGIAAWRATMNQADQDSKPAAWRDDSLDEWRKERDARAEAARASRPAELSATKTGQEEQQETTKKHQRIGG